MITLPVYADVAKLATRGLPASDIARGLDLPDDEVRAVCQEVRADGSRSLYVDDLVRRTKGDPHKLEGAAYLYVRGLTWAEALRHVGVNRRAITVPAPRAARDLYRRKQIRMAAAGVLP